MDCTICCYPYNKSTRKEVTCSFCSVSFCVTCIKSYLLESTKNPHCMNCNHGWTHEFMSQVIPKSFILGPYKEHRENVLIDREKSLLPETQPFAELEMEKRRTRKQMNELQNEKWRIDEAILMISVKKYAINNERQNLKSKCYRVTVDDAGHKYNDIDKSTDDYKRYMAYMKSSRPEISKYNKEMKDLKVKEKYEIKVLEINRLRATLSRLERGEQAVQEKKAFVRACPADGCRGFLSTQWKCGLCEVRVCSKCHEIKTSADHECHPDHLATAELLNKDSKPCPTCASLIFKISGCDQMFCTSCKTAFSWKTGRVEKGHIHNPHYFEYLRQNGQLVPRNPLDVPHDPCGFTDIHTVTNKANVFKVPDHLRYKIRIIFNDYHDIQGRVIPAHRVDDINDNRELRVKYLLGEMNEGYWKKRLQQIEKKREKKIAVSNVYQMITAVVQDIFNRMNAQDNKKEFLKVFFELKPLAEYATDCFEKIGKRFNSVAPALKDCWTQDWPEQLLK